MITPAQLYALAPGQKVIVKVADVDGIKPDARGQTFTCYVDHVFSTGADAQDARQWMLWTWAEPGRGYPRSGRYMPGLRYGFHGWLIESVEVIK